MRRRFVQFVVDELMASTHQPAAPAAAGGGLRYVGVGCGGLLFDIELLCALRAARAGRGEAGEPALGVELFVAIDKAYCFDCSAVERLSMSKQRCARARKAPGPGAPADVLRFAPPSRVRRNRSLPQQLTLDHVSPATRRLEKRRHMFEVQEALDAQKEGAWLRTRPPPVCARPPARRSSGAPGADLRNR